MITGAYYLKNLNKYTKEEEQEIIKFAKKWLSKKEFERRKKKNFPRHVELRLKTVYEKVLFEFKRRYI